MDHKGNNPSSGPFHEYRSVMYVFSQSGSVM